MGSYDTGALLNKDIGPVHKGSKIETMLGCYLERNSFRPSVFALTFNHSLPLKNISAGFAFGIYSSSQSEYTKSIRYAGAQARFSNRLPIPPR